MSGLVANPRERSLPALELGSAPPQSRAHESLEHSPSSSAKGDDPEEQALESHEVIELQTFSERKAWIEEKIKFLEKMPPIEVFMGLDSLRQSAEDIPGLPTRDDLRQWIAEHDVIEKETESFDKGELKKLRQLTKAATQRNLSPQDTDLIELTLTTIYELDKLLHLLRGRSENLDLLGIRLDWEENRSTSWKDRRKILEDLETFITTRARWSPSIYEAATKGDESPTLTRRGSVTSLASINSESSVNSSLFSRSARFKLAEVLSRDAAQFGARVTNLSHARVATAGRILDKLIDHSRRPVPDVLLDEQDRLEEKSINQLENVGKFVLSLVMQWRKADEIYVETMKDQIAAKELWEEIQIANMHHPTLRQSSSFTSRADTLLKRLSVRGNPASRISTFPKPEHHLFSQQREANESLAQYLSGEIATATELAQKVERASREYQDCWEAVHQVEVIVTNAAKLSDSFSSIVQRLSEGVAAENEDGSPPNLMSDRCLDPNRHSVFLALLPSIQTEAFETTAEADGLIKQSHLAFYSLGGDSVDPVFKSNATEAMRHLSAIKDQCQGLLHLTGHRVARLREARQLWSTMNLNLKELQYMREDIVQQMERDCWKQEAIGSGAPLTPESPAIELLPITPTPSSFDLELQNIGQKLTQTIDLPLQSLSVTLESPLNECLSSKAKSVRSFHDSLLRMNDLLKTIQDQSKAMDSVHKEYNGFLFRVEDVKARLSSLTDNVLGNDESIADIKAEEESANLELHAIQDAVAGYIDGLSIRVPFVSRHGTSSPNRPAFRRSSQGKSDKDVDDPLLHLPVDILQLDAAVRSDSNAYAMRLSGVLESVAKTSRKLEAAQLAKRVDCAVAFVTASIHQATEDLKGLQGLYDTLSDNEQGSVIHDIDTLVGQAERGLEEARPRIFRLFSPIRDLLRQIDTSAHGLEPSVRQSLYVSRVRSLDDAESCFQEWVQGVHTLKTALTARRASIVQRLDEQRQLEEQRRREEEARLAQEEADRRRIAEEDRLEEERKRQEEERQVELERQKEERRKRMEEEAKRIRLEQERREEEERLRLKEEAKAHAARAQQERERIARDEAEKARLVRERHEIEAKLHRTEAQLAEERILQAEKERAALERVRLEKEEIQQSAYQRLLAEKQARERLVQADAERAKAAEEEKRRLETELEFVKGEHKRALSEREILAQQHKQEQLKNRPPVVEDDLFGISGSSNSPAITTDSDRQMRALILGLRKRLRTLSINEFARPTNKKASNLPTQEQASSLRRNLSILARDASGLPTSIANLSVNTELRSFKMEFESSEQLLNDIDKFARLSDAILKCDTVLSDLLEHIDSYPSLPLTVSTMHTSEEEISPSEQLSARATFTKAVMDAMQVAFEAVSNDTRALSEFNRVQQTWLELEEMANDRVGGKKSRPVSSTSSYRSVNSSTSSIASSHSSLTAKKRSSYQNLSVASVRGGKLAPPLPSTPRRSASGADEPRRSSSRMSVSSSRSVSGPLGASVAGSTFASRQRSGSVTGTPQSAQSARVAVARSTAGTPVARTRVQSRRVRSPTISDASTKSFAVPSASRSTATSMSTWARAPRNSLSSLVPRSMTPQKKPFAPAPRKKYVANPKNKLDVAVGDVVNQLPVGINVEGVEETWRDQSGKYWIGNQDPKLCFCRILRSQTVMVRVGGGWTELSKFIKDHFAESFRLLPESPSRSGKLQEEKWISSATLLEQSESEATHIAPPAPPKTPEPLVPFVPSFCLSTPSGQSPRSIRTSPSVHGSPLTPLQFLRRADADPTLLRPASPSKTPSRPRIAPSAITPSRAAVWRP